jgi:hypothetical protein
MMLVDANLLVYERPETRDLRLETLTLQPFI